MLLSTSPPASVFMPMSDEAMPSTLVDRKGDPASTYSLYGRIKTFPMFPARQNNNNINGNSSGAKGSVHHRRTFGLGLSLQDFKIELSSILGDEGAAADAKKSKKRVVFADDRGYELAQIKIMTEPSDVPPKLRSAVVRALLCGAGGSFYDDAEARPCSQWSLTFKQPASEYVAFRKRLDEKNVALENVLLKNDQCRMSGTVKVKNLCFNKSVFVRLTDNNWKTFVDHECKYSPHIGTTADSGAFDTWQFDFELPIDDEKRTAIEFCICFRSSGDQEYWDSNDGKNFRLVGGKHDKCPPAANLNNNNNNVINGADFTPFANGQFSFVPANDALKLNFDNWTQFASWNHLTTDGPYW